MKKYSRPFSIFLVLILSFSFLTVNAFASSDDNLIDPNMSTWEYIDYTNNWNDPVVSYSSSTTMNDISFGSESVSNGDFFTFYDLSSLNLQSGESYHFTFIFDSSNWGGNSAFFNVNSLFVGFATLSSSGDLSLHDDCYVELSSSTYSSFSPDSNTVVVNYDFVCPDYIGSPGFSINILRFGAREHTNLRYRFSNLSLTRNTSPELDGILGFLKSIVDTLSGLADKIKSDFSTFFDVLNNNIDEFSSNVSSGLKEVWQIISNKLTEVQQNISGEITSSWQNIVTKLTNVVNSIGVFFDDLKSSLSSLFQNLINYILYFDDEVPENPFTGVDSPLDHVQGFFDELIDYLSSIRDDIETVIDSVTGPIILLDEFTKRFEWLFGIVTFVLMMIVVSRFIGL